MRYLNICYLYLNTLIKYKYSKLILNCSAEESILYINFYFANEGKI